MKVFDFTTGKKGAQVGDVQRPSWFSGWLDGNDVLRLAKSPMALHMGCGITDKKTGKAISLDPAAFGCEAVCFSIGQLQDGTWEWMVVGTPEWRVKAEAAGIITRRPLQPALKLSPLHDQIEKLLGRSISTEQLAAVEQMLASAH